VAGGHGQRLPDRGRGGQTLAFLASAVSRRDSLPAGPWRGDTLRRHAVLQAPLQPRTTAIHHYEGQTACVLPLNPPMNEVAAGLLADELEEGLDHQLELLSADSAEALS
jgi:hypothetical protein